MQENHYYPFGINHDGRWFGPQDPENRYTYNGKEYNPELGLDWYDYGAKWYDAALGRFTGVDPIADQFAWVSPYNYAENEPVGSIDLHGLQRSIYDRNAFNNKTFQSAHAINEQTSGGKRFSQALKNQSKIDVVYAISERGSSGLTAGPYKNFEEFSEDRANKYNLYYSTENNWRDYEDYFEEGKEVIIIAVACDNTCGDDEVREAAHTLNHEEVAHGINILSGIEKSQEDEHEAYNGLRALQSPDTNDIKNNLKYKKPEAKKQLYEIDKIMQYEK